METLAWLSIAVAIACAVGIAIDVARRPQPMAIMNIVWPVTALYFSVFAVWSYVRIGHPDPHAGHSMGSASSAPTAAEVARGTSHCGAGCMLADVGCAFWIAAAGVTLFGSPLWAEFAIDFVAAWVLGIAFQYFAIKPMGKLTARQALAAAIKTDTLSIVAFQIGMYAWMMLVYFVFFAHPHVTAFDPRYWLMMQVAMICGFATSYPMNRWLILRGLKEAM